MTEVDSFALAARARPQQAGGNISIHWDHRPTGRAIEMGLEVPVNAFAEMT